MKVITLAKTKELLGITDTSLDTEITRYIPIIDAKVKQMTGNRYNMQIIADTTVDSKVLPISGITNVTGGIQNNWVMDDIGEYIQIGSLIEGDNIAADTYVDEFHYELSSDIESNAFRGVPTITLSANATATEASIVATLGINIGLQPTIAKGIAWLITQESITAPTVGGVSSKSIGTISISYGDSQAKIDGRYGMPLWFVKAFPVYHSGH